VILGAIATIGAQAVRRLRQGHEAGPTSTARWASAPTPTRPQDAQRAREFGAEGIGLCRTEHMFFEGDRIKAMREMILAETKRGREKALAKLLPYQRDDFVGIFKAMKGLPVTIRLLDPPLHEFLPHDEKSQPKVAKMLKVSAEKVRRAWRSCTRSNPMLGHRGCRLAVTYPEILEMQVRPSSRRRSSACAATSRRCPRS
jgi:pyruvate,orthophosphate dikinase